MRLIDADALEKRFDVGQVYFGEHLRHKVATAPTVDAVRVVRCRDCRYSKSASDDEDGYQCLFFEQFFQKDGGTLFMSGDYCSHGKRKDDEDDQRG